jgi:hypothetical protein
VDFDCPRTGEIVNENTARRITAKAARTHARIIMSPFCQHPANLETGAQ